MRQYHELLHKILDTGNDRGDRTGTGTRSIFGYQFRHNLAEGFPLLTTKRLPFKTIVVELLWFLRGDTNIKYLLENDVHIWSKDAYRFYNNADHQTGDAYANSIPHFEELILTDEVFAKRYGDLGPMYGKQWRAWQIPGGRTIYDHRNTIDQIANVITSIRKNPEGRRHIVTAWNPSEVDSMVLPPCHCLYQFYVSDGRLSCHMYQRSADVFLGVPFNIASYALLTHIIAHQTDLGVGDLVISFGDVHIYNNHREQVLEQLTRDPWELPILGGNLGEPDIETLKHLEPSDFWIINYHAHPAIKGELSVG